MKKIILLSVSTISLLFTGCAKEAENLVKLDVNVPWKQMKRCDNTSPKIDVSNLPKETKKIEVELLDRNVPSWNHGGGSITYNGSNSIPEDALKDGYNGPCPPMGSHTYVFQVKAVDENNIIIGKGESKSLFP